MLGEAVPEDRSTEGKEKRNDGRNLKSMLKPALEDFRRNGLRPKTGKRCNKVCAGQLAMTMLLL